MKFVSSIATEILKLAQAQPDADNPEAKPGEEVEIDYEKLPLAIQNVITKIRLRQTHFKKCTKRTDRGTATYILYFKPIELKFAKTYLKALFNDRSFTNITYKTTKELTFEFQMMER